MAVVVTGAAGFLGRALVTALAADGVTVVTIDRRPLPATPDPTGAAGPAGPLGAHGLGAPGMGAPGMGTPGLGTPGLGIPGLGAPGLGAPGMRRSAAGRVTEIRADLLDGDPAVAAALRGADAVFHLAGRPGVRDAGPAADAARVRDNVLATATLLDLVPRDVPLVVTSSSSVYGGAGDRPSREDDPLRPLGAYARSKAMVEQLCAGRPVAVLRPFTVAGEGQRPDMALARWIAAVRAGRPIRILGSPARTRDVTDVRDLVRAARLAADRGVTGPLNVGTGRPRTLAELAGSVCRVLGAPAELVVGPAAAVEPAATWADTTRLARTLGFVPATDLDALVTRQALHDVAAPEPALVAG